MSDFNPYAPPEAPTAPPVAAEPIPSDYYRDGGRLVLRIGAELPARCVRCNAPAGGVRVPQKALRLHLWWPVYRTARVAAPLCPYHSTQRRRSIAVCVVGLVASIGLLLIMIWWNSPLLFVPVAAILLFFICLETADDTLHVVAVHRITARFVWLNKVGPAFLAELPAWPAGRGWSP